MIKFDGITIPNPTDYTVGVMDLSQATRNARGNLVVERIATKRKLELSWDYLNKESLSKLLKLASPVFFQVEYIDPQDNNFRTGTFYAGDRKAGALRYKNGNIYYKDVKFNIIER